MMSIFTFWTSDVFFGFGDVFDDDFDFLEIDEKEKAWVLQFSDAELERAFLANDFDINVPISKERG